MNKDKIISEIKRLTVENGGITIGERTFRKVTGIPSTPWRGGYWNNWSELVEEAGLAKNIPKEKTEQSFLLLSLAKLTRKYKKFPTYAATIKEKRTDKAFPHASTFNQLGSQKERIELVRKYAQEYTEYSDILQFLPEAIVEEETTSSQVDTKTKKGEVYLFLLNVDGKKRYKIGNSYDADFRMKQASVGQPEPLEKIWTIKTDDAYGIEAYWHKRFKDKNTRDEWFKLTHEDIQAFKKRKFM